MAHTHFAWPGHITNINTIDTDGLLICKFCACFVFFISVCDANDTSIHFIYLKTKQENQMQRHTIISDYCYDLVIKITLYLLYHYRLSMGNMINQL